MYCSECGRHNPEDSKFCQHCGAKFHEHYGAHLVEKKPHEEELSANKSPYPYVISTQKLVILTVVTFGLYEIYWFYRQWKSFKAERDLKVTPWARSLFATIMSYSLFNEITKAVKSIDKSKSGLEAGGLAIVYFIAVNLANLPDPYWWLYFLSVIPLIYAQNAINFYWKEKYNKVEVSKFGGWNYVWALIGGIVVLLAIYGTVDPSLSESSNTENVNSETTVSQQNTTENKGYNQDEVVSSVVNIFCPSTVRNEDTSGGSGTILNEEGVILTNSHIIPQDKKNLHVDEQGCMVVLPDPKTGQPKEVYWGHPVVIPEISDQYDLAFISIYSAFYDEETKEYQGTYPKKFPAFDDTTRCNSEDLKLGEAVRIFGYPAISGGYSLTITDGLVSSFPGDGLIVTSAKISHGNSGGLAVDEDGCMVGVPSMVSSDDSESLGVIYSMHLVRQFADKATEFFDKQ